MSDVERIAPPVPPLPSPVGRNVGSKRRRPPRGGGRHEPGDAPADPGPKPSDPPEHIDEYV